MVAVMADEQNENFFERKYGNLPMWAWIALGVGVLLVWSSYRPQTAPSNANGPPPNSGTGSGISPYMVLMPSGQQPPTPASNTVAHAPTSPTGPASPDKQAYGFDWSQYQVLGLQPSRHTQADTSPIGIAQTAYGLNKDDTANASYFAGLITQNNPGIDWSKPLPAGTTVWIPKLGITPPGAQPTQFN
jgi:hypothetical protein